MANDPDRLDIEYQLSQYLDGQLTDRQAAELERRLARDERLRDELELYKSLDGHVRGLADADLEEMDFDLQQVEIMAALERKTLLKRARPRMLVFRPRFAGAMAAAATVVLAVAAWVVYHPSKAVEPGAAVVSARVLPNVADSQGKVEVACRKMDQQELQLAHPGKDEQAAPSGTVMVSTGPDKNGNGQKAGASGSFLDALLDFGDM